MLLSELGKHRTMQASGLGGVLGPAPAVTPAWEAPVAVGKQGDLGLTVLFHLRGRSAKALRGSLTVCQLSGASGESEWAE